MSLRTWWKPRKIISRYLDTDGDGGGTVALNGNYTAQSPGIVKISPIAGQHIVISRLIVTIEDTSGFSASEYGNLGAALNPGITLRVVDDIDGVQPLTLAPIKTNAEWGAYCYDVDIRAWGAGNEFLSARWTFSTSGYPIWLAGSQSASLEVYSEEDLTGLVLHRFLVQGFYPYEIQNGVPETGVSV